MWIHSIKLKNFKAYKDTEFHFPEPSTNKNLVLIGAVNGDGKTTLLEAIYLCFYDRDAESYLKRAGLNQNQRHYADFLSAALNTDAKAIRGLFSIELEIEIRERYSNNTIKGLKIQRKWHFDQDRRLMIRDNEAYASIFQNDGYQLIDKDDIPRYLNLHALPMDYAPFFFFDGEKISDQAAESGAGKWLNTGLKLLVGITLLDNLRVSLRDYRTSVSASENKSQRLQNELSNALQSFQAAENSLNVLQENLTDVQADWLYWSQERDTVTSQLGRNQDIRGKDEFIEQRIKLEQEMKEFESKIQSAIKAMPLAFLPRGSLKKLKLQLEHEKNRLMHEAGKERLESRVDDFWAAFIASDKVREVLGRSATTIFEDPLMKEAVMECWDKLFYPLKDDCAQHIEHNYLSIDAHNKIQHEMNQLQGMPNTKLGDLIAAIEKREEERRQVIAEIDSFEGTNRDELIQKLREAEAEVEALREKMGELNNKIESEENKRDSLQREVSRLQDEIDNSNPKLQKSRRAGNVGRFIDELTQKLLQKKIKEVEETAIEICQSIIPPEKMRISRMQIVDGKMVVYNKNGQAMNIDDSSGQVQILLMSLVYALAKVTDYHAPFVIDTPLARISENNRMGLCRYWVQSQHQIILLVTDTEITHKMYQALMPYTGKTYLIDTPTSNNGGGYVTLQENRFFDKKTFTI